MFSPWHSFAHTISLTGVSRHPPPPRVRGLQIAILFIKAAWRRRVKYWGYLLQDRPDLDVRPFLRMAVRISWRFIMINRRVLFCNSCAHKGPPCLDSGVVVVVVAGASRVLALSGALPCRYNSLQAGFSVSKCVCLMIFWFWVWLGLGIGLRSPLLYFPRKVIFFLRTWSAVLACRKCSCRAFSIPHTKKTAEPDYYGVTKQSVPHCTHPQSIDHPPIPFPRCSTRSQPRC